MKWSNQCSCHLTGRPVKANSWIIRGIWYKLYLNGSRTRFGPAPYDPRWAEAASPGLCGGLTAVMSMIGAEVLFTAAVTVPCLLTYSWSHGYHC